MKNEHLVLVIDTNIWVSIALGSRIVSEQMFKILQNQNFRIFTSNEQMLELTNTLEKPKLQKFLTHNRTRYLFELIWDRTYLIEVTSNVEICRDPNDDFIINLALDSEAEYILTGDLDLIVLDEIRNIKIRNISDFLRTIEEV